MLLTICLAIYKRVAPFRYTFEALLKQIEGLDSVEIVVSVNPSEDGNHDLIDYVTEKHRHFDFKLFINEKNIGGEANINNAVKNASGKFVWIIGDDDLVLPSSVNRVLGILNTYPDVTWIFMNTARVSGKIEEESRNLIVPKVADLQEGYYANGIECALKTHKLVDAAMLFSSSNVYLRESMLVINASQEDADDCNQLASAFNSASRGAAFLIDTPCILAGGARTWTDREDFFLGMHYNRDILYAVNYGIDIKQAKDLIAYRMRHDALRSWFSIFKMIFHRNKLGFVAYKELFRLIPIETVLCTVFSPFIAAYLLCRHKIRNKKRMRICKEYLHNPHAIKEIKDRIPYYE